MHRPPSRSRSTSRRAATWRTCTLALFAVALLAAAGLVVAQERVITPVVSIEQNLLPGGYTVNEVLQSGRQFFAAAYLPADGHGEGDFGPRADMRRALWDRAVTTTGVDIPFLRVNGLDSQACFGCHNSAGTHVPEGQLHRTQKPGGLGGAADFASVLLGNQFFPEQAPSAQTESDSIEKAIAPDPTRLTHIVRAPPKSFGTAYLQELAIEMTGELQALEAAALTAASQSPGTTITVALAAKGVDFGQLSVTCPDNSCNDPTRDTSGVEGVSPADLIVRPFQHKGVTATLRSFTKTALDFHFSMQPVEVVGIDNDCDADRFRNEMAVDIVSFAGSVQTVQVQQSLGNTLALAAFAGMLRPPVTSGLTSQQQARGEQIFADIGCTSCHVPTLTTRARPQFRIELADPAEDCPEESIYGATAQLGSFAEAEAAVHPAIKTVEAQRQADAAARGAQGICPNDFYCIDLTNPGPLPAEFLPRLPANDDQTVTVPLYSDLKRHDLGHFLAQTAPAQADDAGNPIPNREWLTTKLWGVADNGPWLHDGRARTLEEAILMHDGEHGNGNDGEAVAEVNAFQSLSNSATGDLIAFLESLSVPIP